ncbi:MAG: hypothetical protein Q4P71_09670 [Actinomycetaceae bacterium]|nr:hypothetical protein [Actinomycetaceae bacterium]
MSDTAVRSSRSWSLDDPSGRGDDAFRETIALIETTMRDLARRRRDGLI